MNILDVYYEIDKCKRVNKQGSMLCKEEQMYLYPKAMKVLSSVLKVLAKKVTSQCSEFQFYQELLEETFDVYFGNPIFDVSIKCSLFRPE